MKTYERHYQELIEDDRPLQTDYDLMCVALYMSEHAVMERSREAALARAVGWASRP